MKTVHYALILAVFSSVIFFTQLGGMALTEPDETFYAQTAKEMLDDGDWITPRIFGEAQYEKPPFYYWLIMLSYMVFGVSEFSARFPSALFAVLGVFGVFLLGKLLYSRLVGFISAVILATSLEYFVVGRGCVTDTVLTVFIVYVFLFFMTAWTTGRRRHYYAAAVMAALAVLTKGPIGLFIPGASILIYLAITGQIKDLFRKVPVVTSFVLFCAVALPWYIIVALSNGQTFASEFFGFHNITRFVHPEHKIGDTPVFYLPVVIGGMFPWSVFFLCAFWGIFRKEKHPGIVPEGALRSPKAFLAAWFLLVFIFFSVSRTKLVTYILPLFPAAAVMTGNFWAKIISPGVLDVRGKKVIMAVFMVTSFIAAAGAIGLVLYELPYAPVIKGTIIASCIFLACAVIAYQFERKGKPLTAFFAIAVSVILLMPPVMAYILPAVEVYESRKALSLKIKELSSPDEHIGAEDDHRRGVAFYSGRVKVEDIHSSESRIEFFNRKERVWGVLKSSHYDIVKEHFKENAPIEVKRSGKHVLVTNMPL
jgi:4-amino-4-deoxy-L-arabinose transferase-like glycosyltransferase